MWSTFLTGGPSRGEPGLGPSLAVVAPEQPVVQPVARLLPELDGLRDHLDRPPFSRTGERRAFPLELRNAFAQRREAPDLGALARDDRLQLMLAWALREESFRDGARSDARPAGNVQLPPSRRPVEQQGRARVRLQVGGLARPQRRREEQAVARQLLQGDHPGGRGAVGGGGAERDGPRVREPFLEDAAWGGGCRQGHGAAGV